MLQLLSALSGALLLFFIIVGSAKGIIGYLSRNKQKKDLKIAEQRRQCGYTEKSLLEELAKEGIPADIANEMASYLVSIYWVPNFPFLSTDKLRGGLNSIDLIDLENIVKELCSRCNAHCSSKDIQQAVNNIVTVQDLAKFVTSKTQNR